MRSIKGIAVKLSRAPTSICVLTGLLLASEFIYIALLRFEAVSTARSVVSFIALLFALFGLYALACWLLTAIKPIRSALGIVLVGAFLFRVTLLFAGMPPHATWTEARSRLRADIHGQAVTYDSFLLFDNDIWRYLWDAQVSSSGVNPYAFEPGNPQLDRLVEDDPENATWADIRANVNHKDVPTIYPPLAQMLFRFAYAVAPGSVFLMKSLFVAFDLATVAIILFLLRMMHRPSTDVILYGWNPLVIKVVAGSGHMDAVLGTLLLLMVLLLVRGHRSLATTVWALAVLTKITPVLLLPFLSQRVGWRRTALGLGVVAAGFAPYLDKNGAPFVGLMSFAREWQFNSGFISLLELSLTHLCSTPAALARALTLVAIVIVLVFLMYRERKAHLPFHSLALLTLGVAFVLSPTVMPWYIVPILPLAVVARSYLWVRFSAFLCLAFAVMIDGRDNPWVLLVEWGVFAVLAYLEYAGDKKHSSLVLRQAEPEGAL
ncbi:MAG: hypothetical protein ACM3JB_12570 [Acidobacteriaceae bacterium]